LAGNAAVKQGNTTIKGDSIVVNQLTGIAEVFGNVHINDADSVDTYSQYLRYLGKERVAYLKKSVKLTDGKATLFTDDLEYNLATGIATYKNGGRVVNGKTILTSSDAVYYSDTKDVYFKKYVHLTDPKYDIVADSLLYNTYRKEATFISPTRIKSKDGGVINTRNGTYNLETGQAEFYDRTSISDSSYFVTGGKIAYEEKAGILQIEENGKIVDSVNHVTILGGLLYLNKKDKSFLGTRKPIMIIYKNNDSTYVAADTLFSGIRKFNQQKKTTVDMRDTLSKTTSLDISNSDSIRMFPSAEAKKDSLNIGKATPAQPDTIRYFLGFHHVRIFNDSLQAVSDSMYYSTEDSVFRLFKAPVFWNGKSQVSGDTMYLFTETQKPKRLYVFNNSMVINEADKEIYNQVAGRNLNAYFRDGSIDYVRVKGSPAESVFYPQDDDSAYIGMNRSSGDVIDVYFINKTLNRVKFINSVDGTLYPIRLTTNEQKFLKGFMWQDKRRPKNKLELFE
jgi:lipopolysaccharide export system protein LptA